MTARGDVLRVEGEGPAADVRVLAREGARLLLEVTRPDGSRRRLHVAAARAGNTRHLWVDGRHLTADRVRQSAAARGPEQGSLAASIPAVVSQVLVAVGDEIAAGDKLILLESMKMVIPILAPHGGRVSQIHCAPGDSVPAGVPLLEIEPE